MHHMTEHYLFCFYREITCFCSSMIYQNIQLLIFILAMFLAIIIDYTDNNNPDDTNFLIKNIEKMKRSCSKLFSNYCMKTNPGTPTNEIYQNQWMQSKCSPCFQSVSFESKLTLKKKKNPCSGQNLTLSFFLRMKPKTIFMYSNLITKSF